MNVGDSGLENPFQFYWISEMASPIPDRLTSIAEMGAKGGSVANMPTELWVSYSVDNTEENSITLRITVPVQVGPFGKSPYWSYQVAGDGWVTPKQQAMEVDIPFPSSLKMSVSATCATDSLRLDTTAAVVPSTTSLS